MLTKEKIDLLVIPDSFRDGTPVENVRAYFDAAHRYD